MIPNLTILTGDCRETLKAVPSGHFHCVVTSPPYWGLRDYQNAPILFGGKKNCRHEWTPCGGRGDHPDRSNQGHDQNGSGLFSDALDRGSQGFKASRGAPLLFGESCHCGAWRGQLGLEPTPELYCQHIVEIFREVWRVLRDDGNAWVNLGDTYNFGKSRDPDEMVGFCNSDKISRQRTVALKSKDLVGIPWRVAFALQADGWYLRQDIVWSKPNPMPESITDRCTKSHEYIFLLAKSEDYFFDHEAIKEPVSKNTHSRISQANGGTRADRPMKAVVAGVNPKAKVPSGWNTETTGRNHGEFSGRYPKSKQNESFSAAISGPPVAKRNKRSVWTITTQAFKGAHFATFPERLVEPMILAGTSEKGCCPDCGSQWVRVSELVGIGWIPTCRCSRAAELVTSKQPDRLFDTVLTPPNPVPSRVLDPFGGSGRTAKVALRLGRATTMCELNPSYVELITKQCTPKV